MAALSVASSPAVCPCPCCCSASPTIDALVQSSACGASLPLQSTARSLHKPIRVARSSLGSCGSGRLRPWKVARLSSSPPLRVSANSKSDDSLPPSPEMTFENALSILGVSEGASFEEILKAKNAVLSKYTNDQDMAIQVELAYDVLLMQSLMQRRAGKVIDSSIRYADVKKAKNPNAGPQWVRDAASKLNVTVETPPPAVIGTQTAVYAGLMAWAFASGISSGSALHTNSEVPGPILALGFGASLYFLRKQNVKLGKAAGLTLASLIIGAILGGAVESWLQVDIIPVFGISSPAIVVSEFVLLSFWLSSLYLR